MKNNHAFDLVDLAVRGDGWALEDIVPLFQDKIYKLALRMLSDP